MTKKIIKAVKGHPAVDGAGVNLIRVIGYRDIQEADPFLLLDAFDSTDPKDYINGFPMHPHRGIETVTYLIDGQIDHEDSLGNKGSIQAGQSQWMTAGSGIMHQEMPQEQSRLFGLQLWVNLPKKHKMTVPRYFDITNDMIKTVDIPEGKVRVIAGSFGDAKGVDTAFVKAQMLDIRLNPDAEMLIPMDKKSTVLVYTLEGDGYFGPGALHYADRRTAVIFGEGDTFFARAGKNGLHFMLYSGRPLRESVAWGGPIVMNTQEELVNAFEELQVGTFIR